MARVRDRPVRGTHQSVRPQPVNLRRYGIVVSLPLARKILSFEAYRYRHASTEAYYDNPLGQLVAPLNATGSIALVGPLTNPLLGRLT